MLTVIVGLDGSGKSSTLSPLGNWYSVMPSTSCTFTGVVLAGLIAARWPGLRPCGWTVAGRGSLVACGSALARRAGGAFAGAFAGPAALGGVDGVDCGAGCWAATSVADNAQSSTARNRVMAGGRCGAARGKRIISEAGERLCHSAFQGAILKKRA